MRFATPLGTLRPTLVVTPRQLFSVGNTSPQILALSPVAWRSEVGDTSKLMTRRFNPNSL